ncbi:MAG: glycoside hydrolase family 3 C-terminal domain-containing protein [Bryobacteraceae bacterium]|jgi:beta-glucosidase
MRNVTVFLGAWWLAISLATAQTPTQNQYQYPFQNPNLPMEERVSNIISLLTPEEKVDVLGANYYLGRTPPSLNRLGIHGYNQAEGLHGLARGRAGSPNSIPTTTFIQSIGLGETWDPEILQKAAALEGYEARWLNQTPKYSRGGSVSLIIRAPNADLGRDIRWGRTEECYGEDAFLNGTLSAAFVRGLQGNDPKYWQTAALLKHFLANSNEKGRMGSSSNFDERLLREYYSVPFRMGVEAGARSYMAAYNGMNGIPMTAQPILKEITIKEWGVNHIITTDAGSLEAMVNARAHHYFPDLPTAAAGAIKVGINQFLDGIYKNAITQALEKNLLTMAEIEEVERGSFRVMIKLGLLDPPEMVPYAQIKDGPEPWTRDENKLLARQVTQEAVVLLKNQNNLLPLDKSKLKSIAVVGQRSNDVAWDWYSGAFPYTVTPLDGIKNKVGPGVKVNFALNNDNNAAVEAAKASDVAIVVIGNHPTCDAGWGKCEPLSDGKEGIDRRAIDLQPAQEQLIKDVLQANPRTIVVLKASFPFAINWAQENVPAIVHMAHNSQEEGNALADVLFGDYNPAGRLVQTWVKSIDDLPPMMDYNIRNNRTYMYFKGQPLYPFGYGLSYTTFAYSNLRTSAAHLAKDGEVTVSVKVRNTGKRDGQEVVQLYVQHIGSKVERPIKELKGFQRVALKAGETKTVRLTLKAKDLAYWDMQKKQWVVEDEKVNLMLGGSSADVKVQRTIGVGV